jgi:lactate dehydrogenase-like 2-hydroxyacid dehydrogenase
MRTLFSAARPTTATVSPPSRHGLELHFQQARLSLDTAALAEGHEVVCAFINDELDAPVLERLAAAARA